MSKILSFRIDEELANSIDAYWKKKGYKSRQEYLYSVVKGHYLLDEMKEENGKLLEELQEAKDKNKVIPIIFSSENY